MSLLQNVITITTVLPWNFPRPRGNYRVYRGITAFPVTVSSSSADVHDDLSRCLQLMSATCRSSSQNNCSFESEIR